MSKEVKELLIPRRKVMIDYPNNPFCVGDILIQDFKTVGEVFVSIKEINDVRRDRNWIDSRYIDKYPDIFKEIEWWEDRLPEEMPEYVKHDGTIYQISSHHIDIRNNYGFVLKTDVIPIYYKDCQPATEQEYTQYINSKQP